MLCKNHRNIRFMGSISCIGRILVLEGYLCSSVINISIKSTEQILLRIYIEEMKIKFTN